VGGNSSSKAEGKKKKDQRKKEGKRRMCHTGLTDLQKKALRKPFAKHFI
jgi:hypothetical protein